MAKKWYIIHASSGSENRVVSELRAQLDKSGLSDMVEEILVPKKSSVTVRRGVRVEVEDRVLPGYILIFMECTPEVLLIIRQTPRVIGMLGANADGMPKPLSEGEVSGLLGHLETISKSPLSQQTFCVGETVKISEGLFTSMEGIIEDIDTHRMRLKVSVSILGRPTPVDLEFAQVEKVV